MQVTAMYCTWQMHSSEVVVSALSNFHGQADYESRNMMDPGYRILDTRQGGTSLPLTSVAADTNF